MILNAPGVEVFLSRAFLLPCSNFSLWYTGVEFPGIQLRLLARLKGATPARLRAHLNISYLESCFFLNRLSRPVGDKELPTALPNFSPDFTQSLRQRGRRLSLLGRALAREVFPLRGLALNTNFSRWYTRLWFPRIRARKASHRRGVTPAYSRPSLSFLSLHLIWVL